MMAAMLRDWARPLLKTDGGEPFLHYVLYGKFDLSQPLDKEAYRTKGIPPGIEVSRCAASDPVVAKLGVSSGYVWQQLLEEERPFAERIVRAPECLILRGKPLDSLSLNYLRDTVGLVTHFADRGAVAVYDPLTLRWFKPLQWKNLLFKPDAPVAHRHVAIIESQEKIPTRFWFHTRGMRKFGRPDISIKNVPLSHQPAILEVCKKFVQALAQGSVVETGQKIKVPMLSEALTCQIGGCENDPDFFNRFILIQWPSHF